VAIESFACVSNADLIERCRLRDQLALEEFVRRYQSLVYRVCLRWLRHHHDAEDVAQETFRRATTAMDRCDPARPVEPWLVAIAGNRCRTFLSRQRNRPALLDLAGISVADPSPAVDHASSDADEIARAIASLPSDSRRAFELVHQQGMSYHQVAELMGHPQGTIKTWVHRARLTLIEDLRRREVLLMPPSTELAPTESTTTQSETPAKTENSR